MARLLVIDDSLTVRKVVELSFRSTDWSVDFAANGADGIAAAVRVRPDLILLDFVLPDMKATDVCQRLALHDESAGIPVMIMSGNLEKVRPHFKDMAVIVDLVAKPFTPKDLVARVNAALSRRPAGSGSTPAPKRRSSLKPGRRSGPPPAGVEDPRARSPMTPPLTFSFGHKEAGAKALYARLRGAFAQIPAWAAEFDGSAPAQFFARKILTPQLMTDLMESLLPVYRDVLDTEARTREVGLVEEHVAPGDVAFQGRLASWSVQDLLGVLDASGRTGQFRIQSADQVAILHVHRGEIVLVTCLDPDEYARGSTLDVGDRSLALTARAAAEQRATGKPLFVTLAEAGELPHCDLTSILCEQGKRLLLWAIDQTEARFAWQERSSLPPYVETYGRRISLAQIPLERLRRERAALEAEQAIPSLEIVFERTEGFTRKLRRLDLTSPERLVLALVDRRNSVQTIVDRSGMAAREVVLILHRLARVDLIRMRELARSARAGTSARPIMILEPDVENFQRPLAELLRARAVPIELIGLDDAPDALEAILRVRPSLVILNASAADRTAEKVARSIRAVPEISDLPLVAVLNVPRSDEADQLSAAGFDAVLSKPVNFADIERLLAA